MSSDSHYLWASPASIGSSVISDFSSWTSHLESWTCTSIFQQKHLHVFWYLACFLFCLVLVLGAAVSLVPQDTLCMLTNEYIVSRRYPLGTHIMYKSPYINKKNSWGCNKAVVTYSMLIVIRNRPVGVMKVCCLTMSPKTKQKKVITFL